MEAGRDGFAPHRWLEHYKIPSIVIDPASLEVNRHFRRAKTDRLDAEKLVSSLIRFEVLGERCWRVCYVPSEADMDRRQITREREELVRERTRLINKIKGKLASIGISGLQVGKDFLARLSLALDPRGLPVPPNLRGCLERIYKRLTLVRTQIKTLEQTLKDGIKMAPVDRTDPDFKIDLLQSLKGIGMVTASTLVHEFFGWRKFNNRKEVGSAAGLTPTPYNTGKSDREQGISKAGSARVRRVMIEAAWSWLRYQPQSALSVWFNAKFGQGRRKKGIVALARKLLIELWHFVEQGVLPRGALERL